MDKADLKNIDDSINYRMDRRSSFARSSYFFAGLVSLIIGLLLYMLFS
ncbi:hypothetical protein [Algoriphagus sp. AGSA1]|nr:hypothetical protein [Algoriphagus sp. AGSA1]